MKRSNFLIVAAAAVVALGAAYFVRGAQPAAVLAPSKSAPSPAAPVPAEPVMSSMPAPTARVRSSFLSDQTVHKLPVDLTDPQQGPRDALVTLVMFGDFEDKWCVQAWPTMSALRAKYGAELRVVWKNLPLKIHPAAEPAAELALAAFEQGGDALFWDALDLLFQNQRALGLDELERHGRALGVEPRRLARALHERPYEAKLTRDRELAARLVPVLTTPLFAINGRFVRGAQKSALFEALIEQELTKARALLARGVPRARIYDAVMEQASEANATFEAAHASSR